MSYLFDPVAPLVGNVPPAAPYGGTYQVDVPAPTGVAATDTANIAAAHALLPATGGTLRLKAGVYLCNALPLTDNTRYLGAGMNATELRANTGQSLFAPTSAILEPVFEELTLSTVGSHLFNFGTTGGLVRGRFMHCLLVTYVNGSRLMYMPAGAAGTSAQFLNNVFDTCFMNRQAGATVPAFELTSSAGAINANEWRNCWVESNDGTAGGPFFRLEGTLAAYCHDNVFKGIVAERCRTGVLHVYSPNGLVLEDIAGWDAGGNYTDHLTAAFPSATSGGKAPRNVRAKNVGTRYGTMDAGKKHVHIDTVPGSLCTTESIGDPNGTSLVSYNTGISRPDASGASGAYLKATTNYTLADTDGTVLFDGSNLTATLPNPSTLPYAGRKFTIKNLNATNLVVQSAGGASIDGAGTKTLAQWATATFITDGAGWYVVG